MKKYLTSSFLILMLFQTVAESRCISGENFEPYRAISQMRSEREIQIESRVSAFERSYSAFERSYKEYSLDPFSQQPSSDSYFDPFKALSQIFDIKQRVRILILENDATLTNSQIMLRFICKAAWEIISSPAYRYNGNDEGWKKHQSFLVQLVKQLDLIYQYVLDRA